MSKRLEHSKKQIEKIGSKIDAICRKYGTDESRWLRSIIIKVDDYRHRYAKHVDYVAFHEK